MKRLAPLFLLGACSLIAPYSITFTTPNEAVVDPAQDTLDLVVSEPALAYISRVECAEQEAIEILPIVHDGAEPQQAWNLGLEALSGMPAGTLCDVTVGAFDQTTTASSYENISLYVLEGPAMEAVEDLETSETVKPTEPASDAPGAEVPSIETSDSSSSETPALDVVLDSTAPAEEPTAEPVLSE